jgi:hypothetical protein
MSLNILSCHLLGSITCEGKSFVTKTLCVHNLDQLSWIFILTLSMESKPYVRTKFKLIVLGLCLDIIDGIKILCVQNSNQLFWIFALTLLMVSKPYVYKI